MFIWLSVYFIGLLLIGALAGRKLQSFENYFFAGRKTGVFLLFITITASWLGAAATLATMEASFRKGFWAAWLIGIPTVSTLLLFVLLAARIRSANFVSLPGFLYDHYGKTFKSLSSVLVFFYMVVLAASQLVAWGQFVSGFFGLGYQATVILGAIIVLAYSATGGFRSVLITDLMQFFLLSAALIILFFCLSPSMPQTVGFDPAQTQDLPSHLLITLSFILAWTVSPIIWQRIAAARSTAVARKSLLISAVVFSLIYFLVMQIGIKFRFYLSDFGSFSAFLQNHLPYWCLVPVFIGIAAAIMSTVDTALNIAALTLVSDIGKNRENRAVFRARLATLLSGALAMLVAFRFDSIISTLGLASEIMAEGLFVPVLAALIWKRHAPLPGLLSLCAGGGFALLSFAKALGLPLPVLDWPYSMPIGVGLSLGAFILGCALEKGRKQS